MQSRSTRAAALSFTVLAGISCAARAAVVDATWINGNSSWHNPAGWNIGVVPNNGADTYDVMIPTGVIEVPAPAVTIDNLNVGPLGTFNPRTPFTTTAGMRVDGIANIVSNLQIGSSGLLAGAGSLTLGTEPGFGTLLTSASALTIDDSMQVRVRQGGIGTTGKPLINRGFISGGGGSVSAFVGGATSRLSFSSIQNLGTLEARGGRFYLNGTFTRADLGNLQWGPNGVFHIGASATLENVGQTFHVEVGKPWFLSGTINGGTVDIDPGANLSVPYWGGAVLNNVTVNGRIYHGGGMPVFADNLMGNAEFQLENQFLEGPSRITSNSSMTIGANVLVHGAGGDGIPGHGSGVQASTSIINHGTIRSDNEFGVGGGITGELTLLAPTLTNDGKLATLAKSWIFASGNVSFAPGGVLDVQMSPTTDLGLLRVVGTLDLTTLGDALILSLGTGAQPNTFYRIATTGGITGQFGTVEAGFEVEYRNGTEIWARFVPEPAAAIIAWCLASIHAVSRRRRRKSA